MNKHAYLIIAHNDIYVLQQNIRLIDAEFNDIFIFVDKKAHSFDCETLRKTPKKSKIEFVERKKVYWGDYSLVEAELILFEKAAGGGYSYVHLLSGADLLIKAPEMIYDFCEKSGGKEFIAFLEEADSEEWLNDAKERVRYYYFFTKYAANTLSRIKKEGYAFRNITIVIKKSFAKLLLKLQILFRVKRKMYRREKIAVGSQWVSITGELARYIVSRKRYVRHNFRHAKAPDELFVQTIVANSEFANRVFRDAEGKTDNLRLIEFDGVNPIIYTSEDWDRLIATDKMIARKFSSAHRDIVDRMVETAEKRSYNPENGVD